MSTTGRVLQCLKTRILLTHDSVCLLLPASGHPVSAKLIAHLSRRYPTQEHRPFFLEHRLFSDTSSQLPGSDVKQRSFTHVLNFSHDAQHAFVSSTRGGSPNELSTITIPVTSADSFASLISTKLQPAWYPRPTLNIEGGVCVAIEEKKLVVCVGDAKVSPRSQGAGTLRGTIVELFRRENITSEGSDYTQEETANDEAWIQGALEDLFEGADVAFNARILTSWTRPRASEDSTGMNTDPDWNLAKLYMAVFRPK